MMETNNIKFKKLKNKVLKKFPKAVTMRTTDGKFYVSDGEGNTLTTEYMIPPQKSVYMAWMWLAETVKVNQNIERTNPNKIEMVFDENKFNRISNRNKHK
jgi:hypothetical protein